MKEGKEIKLPDQEIVIDVKNCSSENQKAITNVMVSLLDKKLRNDETLKTVMSEDCYRRVKRAVIETVEELELDGKHISNVMHGCVILWIRCETYQGLRSLWYTKENLRCQFASKFVEIEEHLQDCYPGIRLDVNITEKGWFRCISQLVYSIEEAFGSSNKETKQPVGDIFSLIKAARSITTDFNDKERTELHLTVSPQSEEHVKHIESVCKLGNVDRKLAKVTNELKSAFETHKLEMKVVQKLQDSSTQESESENTTDLHIKKDENFTGWKNKQHQSTPAFTSLEETDEVKEKKQQLIEFSEQLIQEREKRSHGSRDFFSLADDDIGGGRNTEGTITKSHNNEAESEHESVLSWLWRKTCQCIPAFANFERRKAYDSSYNRSSREEDYYEPLDNFDLSYSRSITVDTIAKSHNITADYTPKVAAGTAVRKPEEHKKTAAAHSISLSQPKTQEKSVPDHTIPKLQFLAITAVRKRRAVYAADVAVRIELYEESPWITGSVMMPGDKLVIVDRRNNTVKLITPQSNKIVANLKIDSRVRDISAVTNIQVAVTCPLDNTILFINVTNTVTLDHKVKVKGDCYGIASISDKLVITYNNPAKVEIISQQGKLLQTVVTEDMGRHFFSIPNYVAVSPDQKTLYISDYSRSTVTSLDLLSGQVKDTYKDSMLKGPCGLTVDRTGVLYVCEYRIHNIHQLTPDLHKIRILLQRSDGIARPQSVSYNVEQNKLYIGVAGCVKVYQLQ